MDDLRFTLTRGGTISQATMSRAFAYSCAARTARPDHALHRQLLLPLAPDATWAWTRVAKLVGEKTARAAERGQDFDARSIRYRLELHAFHEVHVFHVRARFVRVGG